MKSILTIAAGLLLCACVTPTDYSGTQEASADGDYASQRVCVREAPTGTRLPSRTTCRTQAEWDEIRARGQETTRELQRGIQTDPSN